MRVAIVTAGGAGMFCGSCLHDNAWARGLREAGVDATLLPMYTPIRVDDQDHTSTRVFYGGINVYLDQHLPGWRYLPRALTRILDRPGLLRWATKFGVSSNAAELGSMTVALLQGSHGPQAREGAQLVRFLARELNPDVIVYSNVMLAADVAELKREYRGLVLCSLQGDDVFLEGLTPPWKQRALELLRPIAAQIDGFLIHSRYYADFMRDYLSLTPSKEHHLPLAIDCRQHDGRPQPRSGEATIGYFARVAPEKGFREFVEAGLELNQRRQDFRLVAGGYLPSQHRAYFDDVVRQAAPLGARFQYVGSPDTVAEKVAILKAFDLLSVPSPYRDPKGIYVLEAWANGVPVVQPAHGHFPELIDDCEGGLVVEPGSSTAFADAWERLLNDESERFRMATAGWEHVRARHDLPALAQATLSLFESLRSVSTTEPDA